MSLIQTPRRLSGKSMGLVVDDRSINDIVEEHSRELTANEFMQLQGQQHLDAVEEIGSLVENTATEKAIFTSNIKAALLLYVSEFIEKYNPGRVSTGRATALFNDTALAHFPNVLKGRQKQTTFDMFLRKRFTNVKREEIVSKGSEMREKTQGISLSEILMEGTSNNNPPPPRIIIFLTHKSSHLQGN